MAHDPNDCPFCKAGVPLAKPSKLLKIAAIDGKPVDGPTYIEVSASVADAFARLGHVARAAKLDEIDAHIETKENENG